MRKELREDFLERRKKFLSNSYKTPLKQILSYLWEYKKLFNIILILGLFQSVLFLTVPLFLGPALDILVNPEIPLENIIPIYVLMFTVQGIVAILFGIRIYVNRWVGSKVIYNIRNDLFSSIQLMSFGWLDKNKTGELIARTTTDVNNLKEFLGNNLQFFLGRQLPTFVFSFIVLFIINAQLALFVLISAPFLFYVLIMFRKKLRPVFKKSRKSYADLTHKIQENVQGITVVKSFAKEEHEIKKFKIKNDVYYEDSVEIIKLQAKFDPIIYLIDNIAFLVVILLGGFFVLEGNMTFGEIFAFIMVLNFSVEPLYFISRFVANMPQISETAERITYILNAEQIVKEKDNAIDIPNITGDIEFKNVYFSFLPENEHFILKNINFKVKAGETVAILGSTGSGKSALVKLLPRFYDVSKGEILIDGKNVKDFKLQSLRKQIGYVSQERHLFSRSIKENVSFGKKEIPSADIVKATIASDIHSFIENELPEKYDTKVSERGTTLSGGQKQRIAIARALAIKPRILILDDATSSVDVDTEYTIQQHFKEVFKDCTTFLITQRLSSVRNADKILVLEDGEISQYGTHEQLKNMGDGIYKKLYSTIVEERV